MKRSAFLLLALISARLVNAQTPAEQLSVPPGFKVELLKSANAAREGSWVSMTLDDAGRLYISPQGKVPEGGIMRLTLDAQGHIAKTDWLKVDVGAAMGMLWAFNSLYVNGQGPDGQAVYRVTDSDGDGDIDKVALFKKIPGGGGEHGSHGLALGPDGKSIYIVNGNSTPLIDGIAPDSPYRNYADDILVPRVMDPVATFFDNIKIPCGHLLRTDENGTKWELMAGGMRNAYDIDFNADGELFTYDSDMEWDVGMPWYRPSRILHLLPGGEYGFREGNQKWPVSYADSLPPVCDIGLGCPTGVKFGTRSNFPEKYRRAFFVLDWTFGRILAVHMQPRGASYTAKNPLASYTYPTGPEPRSTAVPAVRTAGVPPASVSAGTADVRTGVTPVLQPESDVEVFLSGKAMPFTDLEFGKDGAMYVTVGGRGTQSGLYRVSWVGGVPEPALTASQQKADRREKEAQESKAHFIASLPKADDGAPTVIIGGYAPSSQERRDDRHELERMDSMNMGLIVRTRVPSRNSGGDQFDSFAARTVLERTPIEAWKDKALNASEKPPQKGLSLLLALARVGTKADQGPLLEALKKFPLDSLDDELKLLKLRVIKVSFARQGRPAEDLVQLGIEKLSRQYPAPNFALNRELCELLVWLGAPDVVEKTLKLLAAAPTQEEQIWYACMLREAAGWTPAQRAEYFAWFNHAREFKGGNSLGKFIERIKEQALAHVPDSERAGIAAMLATPPKPAAVAGAPTRPFQKAWTMADLDPELPRVAAGRDFARGKEIFASTQCLQCHHFGPEGGNVGPDLTAVSNRFSRHDILEAIIDPSKVISEQYATFLISTKAGGTIMGQVAGDDGTKLSVLTNPLAGTKEDVVKADILTKTLSPISLMPPGLLSVLTKDEVLDLLAYIESGGNEKAPAFRK